MEYGRYYLGVLMQLTGIAGILAGGGWVWTGILQLPVLTIVDSLLPEDERPRQVSNQNLIDVPLLICGCLGLCVYAALAWKIGRGGSTGFAMAGMVASVGWLSVVPMLPVTHELYDRRSTFRRLLGTYLQVQYTDCTRLFLHLFGHHIHLATNQDADTARRGESIYAFTARMTRDNYRDLFRIERAAAEKRGRSMWSWRSRLVRAIAAYVIFLAVLGLIGGWAGLAAGLAASVIGRVLVESFNYIQHCGLIRVEGQPIEGRHVWNHLAPLTRAAGFEITNHTGHHLDPTLPFYRLDPDVEGLRMPSGYLCFTAAAHAATVESPDPMATARKMGPAGRNPGRAAVSPRGQSQGRMARLVGGGRRARPAHRVGLATAARISARRSG